MRIELSRFESASAAKDFLSPDGLLDIKKLEALNKKVEKAADAYVPTVKYGKAKRSDKTAPQDTITGVFAKNAKDIRAVVSGKGTKITKAKDGTFTVVATDVESRGLLKVLSPSQGMVVKPNLIMAIGIKAKVETFNAAKNRKADAFTYQARRASKITTRTKETDKMRVFLRQYPKGVLPKELEKQVREAFAALATHTRKAEKVKATVQKERGVLKDAKATAFTQAGEELKNILIATGLSEKSIVEGKSMMGAPSLFIKLPKTKQVISINISDAKAMNAAKKASL